VCLPGHECAAHQSRDFTLHRQELVRFHRMILWFQLCNTFVTPVIFWRLATRLDFINVHRRLYQQAFH